MKAYTGSSITLYLAIRRERWRETAQNRHVHFQRITHMNLMIKQD